MRSRFSPNLSVCVIALALVLVANPFPVQADSSGDAAEVERLSAEGVAAYRAGEHARALVLFGQAYALESIPNLLFNMARAYDKMGNDRDAATHYARFLATRDIPTASEERARSLLVAAQERLDIAAKAQALQKSERMRVEAEQGNALRASSAPSSSYAVPGWTAVGAGIALLAVGGTCAAFALDSKDAFHGSNDALVKVSHRDSAESFALAADMTFTLGGIAVGVGTALLLMTDDSAETVSQRSFSPVFFSDGGGVAGTLHF